MLDVVFEKGLGLFDILNDDVFVELKFDVELILELLLLSVDGLNKLFNLFSVVYLLFIDIEFFEVEISGLNLEFDVVDGCEGIIIKKKIKIIRSFCVVIILKVSEFILCLNCLF